VALGIQAWSLTIFVRSEILGGMAHKENPTQDLGIAFFAGKALFLVSVAAHRPENSALKTRPLGRGSLFVLAFPVLRVIGGENCPVGGMRTYEL
jgi:hypothetical protein